MKHLIIFLVIVVNVIIAYFGNVVINNYIVQNWAIILKAAGVVLLLTEFISISIIIAKSRTAKIVFFSTFIITALFLVLFSLSFFNIFNEYWKIALRWPMIFGFFITSIMSIMALFVKSIKNQI